MATPARYRLSTPTVVAVAILLLIPILALCIVPIYARRGPELGGFPFFYWYQLVWVLACAVFTTTAHRLILRERRRGGR